MRNEGAAGERLRGLYAITPDDLDTKRLIARAAACIEGGARIVQYRAKFIPLESRREQARALTLLCRHHGVPLIVNDSIELALEVEADGVHLGRDDADPRAARARLGSRIIGVSCYDRPALAREAAIAGADYVAIGSVFPSATKPGAVRAALELLGEAKRAADLPVVAIGGITAANAQAALAAGADMVAVISAVFSAEDVKSAAREIARFFDEVTTKTSHARAQPRAI